MMINCVTPITHFCAKAGRYTVLGVGGTWQAMLRSKSHVFRRNNHHRHPRTAASVLRPSGGPKGVGAAKEANDAPPPFPTTTTTTKKKKRSSGSLSFFSILSVRGAHCAPRRFSICCEHRKCERKPALTPPKWRRKPRSR